MGKLALVCVSLSYPGQLLVPDLGEKERVKYSESDTESDTESDSPLPSVTTSTISEMKTEDTSTPHQVTGSI